MSQSMQMTADGNVIQIDEYDTATMQMITKYNENDSKIQWQNEIDSCQMYILLQIDCKHQFPF